MTASQGANLALLVLSLAVGALVLWPRRRRPHRPWGLRPGRRTPLHYLTGVGLAVLTVGAGYLALLAGGLTQTRAGDASASAIGTVVAYFVVLSLVEELLFRGLLQNGLWELTGRPVLALVATALLVAVPYLLVDGITPLGVLGAVLAGIMYGLAYLATGSVWTAAGMRMAWNVVLGAVLGFTVSGATLTDLPLLEQRPDGPGWLTGGDYGPEAGAVVVLARVGVIIALLAWWRRRTRADGGPDGTAARHRREVTTSRTKG